MFCTNCGGILPPTAKFCGGCGTKVDIASESKSATSTRLFDAPSTSVHRQIKSIERVGDPNSIKPDTEVRCLFVIGAEQTYEAESWLKKCFPNSTVKRFTTKNEIRDLVLKLASERVVDCLCLVGTAVTVPPFRIIKDHSGDGESYEAVESDIFYSSNYNFEEMLPGNYKDVSNHVRSLYRVGVDDAIGLIPVGRLPYDEFIYCKNYFLSLYDGSSGAPSRLITIANSETPAWFDECVWVEKQFEKPVSSLKIPVDCQMDGDVALFGQFVEGACVQINLHGSPAQLLVEDDYGRLVDNPDNRQIFRGYAGKKKVPISEDKYIEQKFGKQEFSFDHSASPQNIIWLYACYGGHSGWWGHGLIHKSLIQGASAVVASSDTSYVSHVRIGDSGEIFMPPSSAEICSNFFKYIDDGLSFGKALSLAKAETLKRALDGSDNAPDILVLTLKEVCQFSLYGAPWFSPNRPKSFSPAANKIMNRSGSLLENIRSGQRMSTAMEDKTDLLSHLRESLHKSLGSGADFFTLSRQSALDAYRNSGTLDRITANIRSQGYEFEKSRFESVHLLGQDFQIAYAPSANKESTSHLMVVLGKSGEVMNTYQSKG